MTIRVSTLSNGLRVASDSMDGVPSTSLGIWAGVGTRNETAEINGVAHMLEHMLFKGTARRSAFAISADIENVGGHLNAYTTREQTAYYARVLPDDVPLALEIIADMLQNSLLDPEELARERTVILQEIGQAFDTPDDYVFDLLQATAFPDQALGRAVLGTADIVATLPREALTGYLGRHYCGRTLVLAAAGQVDHDALVAQAETLFAALPAGAPPAQERACYAGGNAREDRDLEQVHLTLGFQGTSAHDPDFYPASVLATVLGGGMSSRLFQEVREKRGLVYSIYTFSAAYQDGGLFALYAGTDPDRLQELVPVVCAELVRAGQDVTEEEILRARAQLKAGTLMALESSSNRCELLAQQLLTFGRPIPTDEVIARINAVDVAAVQQAARRIFATPPAVAALGPLELLESYPALRARLTS